MGRSIKTMIVGKMQISGMATCSPIDVELNARYRIQTLDSFYESTDIADALNRGCIHVCNGSQWG